MSLNILDMKQVYGLKPYSAMYIKGRYSCLLVQNVKNYLWNVTQSDFLG